MEVFPALPMDSGRASRVAATGQVTTAHDQTGYNRPVAGQPLRAHVIPDRNVGFQTATQQCVLGAQRQTKSATPEPGACSELKERIHGMQTQRGECGPEDREADVAAHID